MKTTILGRKGRKMAIGLCLCLGLVVVALRAATVPAFEWIPLQTPASPDKALNIVITGDGYTATDKTTFLADCQELVDAFSGKEPWKTYITHINFYASWVISNQAGVSILNGTQVDTAFKTQYDVKAAVGGIEADGDIVRAYKQAVPVRGFHFLIVNSNAYEAGDAVGASYAILFRDNANGKEIAGTSLHEAGHLIGRLSDEYLGGSVTLPAVNVATDLNNIPWAVWLDAGAPIPTPDSYAQPYTHYAYSRVGAFQGAYIASAYRPTYSSLMCGSGDGGGEYGPVNSEALVLAIYAVTGPQLSIKPEASTVQIGEGKQQEFTPVTWSAPSTIGTAWYLDGDFYASTATLTLRYSDLRVGTHTLRCVVKDNTSFVRKDPKGLLTSTTDWTVVVGNLPTITNQPVSQGVVHGQSVSFSVTATGSNLSYQWRKGGVSIAGATSASYSIGSAQTGDDGSYDCVVTNNVGSVTSHVANLTVAGSTNNGSGSSGAGACGGWFLLALVGCVWLRFGAGRKRRLARGE